MDKKILVADDDRDILKLIEVGLGRDGYSVISAFNGKEAVEKACSEKPDLIILDIVMPEMDGNEALKALKKEKATRKIPVVMLTGQGSLDEIERCFSEGALDYIIKPFDLRTLKQKIEKFL